MTDVKVSVPPS